VVLVFISQTVKIGDAAPTETGSSARVTFDKTGGRWLVSDFDHY
jgi:Mce-associated membrane protein